MYSQSEADKDARISALESELAEARRDGERFRFQFDPANLTAMTDIELKALNGDEPHGIDWWREKIDAARKEGV